MDDQTHKDIQMDIEELADRVDELTKITEDNNKMIRSLYQRARISTVFILLKWVIIIGITVGSFYYIQPYIESVMGVYTNLIGGGEKDTGFDFFKFLKSM